jgi:hypothetical protein
VRRIAEGKTGRGAIRALRCFTIRAIRRFWQEWQAHASLVEINEATSRSTTSDRALELVPSFSLTYSCRDLQEIHR